MNSDCCGQVYLLLWAFQDHLPLFQAVAEAAGVQEYDCHWLWEGSPQKNGDGCSDLCDEDRVKCIGLKIRDSILENVNTFNGHYEFSNKTEG